MTTHRKPKWHGAYDFDNSTDSGFSGDAIQPIEQFQDVENSELQEFVDDMPRLPPNTGCGNCWFIAIISLLSTSNFMTAFTMGPFIADLIVDLGVVESQGDAPKYAGLVSLFPYLGQAVSVVVACRLATLLGTKPILITGALLHTVLMFLLAFTTNFPFLLIIRTLQGCLCATLQVACVAMGQRKMSQAWRNWGFGVLNSFANLGFVVGAFLGGFLSRPVQQYDLFRDAGFVTTLFSTFPLLLVYVVSGIFGVTALFLVCFTTESSSRIRRILKGLPEEDPDDEEEEGEEETIAETPEVVVEPEVEPEAEAEAVPVPVPVGGEQPKLSCGQKVKKCCSSPVFRRIPLSVIIAWYFVRGATMLTSHTLPIVFNLDKEFGGFGFTNYEVGLYGWIDGGFAIIFGPITPLVTRFVNAVHLMRVAPFLIVPAIVLYPELRFYEGATLWIALIGITCLRQMFRQLIFTNILLLMDQCVPPESKPTLQAIAGCGGYAGAGIGPYLGSALLSLGASVNTFPIDSHLCLLLGSGFYIGSAVIAFFLPLSLAGEGAPCTGAKKKKKQKEKEKASASNKIDLDELQDTALEIEMEMKVKWSETATEAD